MTATDFATDCLKQISAMIPAKPEDIRKTAFALFQETNPDIAKLIKLNRNIDWVDVADYFK